MTLIPVSGEFAYATSVVRVTNGSVTTTENVNAIADRADLMVSLDRMRTCAGGTCMCGRKRVASFFC